MPCVRGADLADLGPRSHPRSILELARYLQKNKIVMDRKVTLATKNPELFVQEFILSPKDHTSGVRVTDCPAS